MGYLPEVAVEREATENKTVDLLAKKTVELMDYEFMKITALETRRLMGKLYNGNCANNACGVRALPAITAAR